MIRSSATNWTKVGPDHWTLGRSGGGDPLICIQKSKEHQQVGFYTWMSHRSPVITETMPKKNHYK